MVESDSELSGKGSLEYESDDNDFDDTQENNDGGEGYIDEFLLEEDEALLEMEDMFEPLYPGANITTAGG